MEQITKDDKKRDAVISIKALTKSFETNRVLNGVDIEIFKGENVAVLGRSGSGKSVLVKIVCGLLKPDSGHVNVLGEEVDTLGPAALQQLRRKIGFSFQSSALYDSMSVKENLAFPLIRNRRNLSSKNIKTAIDEVLQNVGLSQTLNYMPSELSGGQRKRIGIARTLILNPEIMLYDEPTSGLDPITCVEINNLIIKIQKQYNTTSIIITHDLTCAKNTANRIAMLEEGKFSIVGDFREVFASHDSSVQSFYDYNFTTSRP